MKGKIDMRNHYMTIGNNEATITYSNMYKLDTINCVDICIERATKDDLIHVIIQMPFCNIKETYGMGDNEISYWLNFSKKNYSFIQELAYRKSTVRGSINA